MKYIIFFLSLLLLIPSPQPACASGTPGNNYVTLWELGKSDDDYSDFRFAPNQFFLYRTPGIHIVGVTKPENSWPYIMPGPLDLWAGPGPHSFEIFFWLDKFRQSVDFRLVMDILDAHSYKPVKLRVRVNNAVFEHQFEPGNCDWLMSATESSGREQVATITVPGSSLKPGENKIELTAVEGAYILWDAIRMEAPEGVSLADPVASTYIRSVRARPVLLRGENGLSRPVTLDVVHSGDGTDALVVIPEIEPVRVALTSGRQTVEVLVQENTITKDLKIELNANGKVIASASKRIEPVRHWEVHLIHQTHLDIGFTHTQEEVLEMQNDYLYRVLELIEKTKDYPEEARFKWHAEGMWAVDEFMRTAPEEKRQQYIKALKEQSIHLDAFYVHLLTGLATGEELFELIQPAKEFERKYDVPVITAIGSDVPGYSWGLVSSMANQGIKFLNMAPNNNHRLGYLFRHADQPFYWQSPCGHNKIFTWMASHAYIYFWEQDASMEKVPRFLEYLEGRDFPYDIAMLRYEVGGDNGYPDERLPERVKAWNEKYAWPKIIISTNSQLYHAFVGRYEDKIPVLSGDLTPYWEDGATSTAADLATSRRAGERILQAMVLQSLLKPGGDFVDDFNKAWNNILMYDEHTWGAWSSISDPYGDFTVQQDKYKQRFAHDARDQTIKLMDDIISGYVKPGSGVVDIYNTTSWMRGDLVFLSAEQSEGGDLVVDEKGDPVPCQRLADGGLVFLAVEVPAFGARRYRIVEGRYEGKEEIKINESGISNDLVEVKIDGRSGSVSGLKLKRSGREFVEISKGQLLNDYVYIIEREEDTDWSGLEGSVSVFVEDAGPLVGTLRIESGAAGCEKLVRRVRLVAGQERVDIINTLNKKRVLDPEQAYFTFPLNIPGGQAHVDIPWGVVRPETDQMAGANRNFFTVQRWIDISNENGGLTWVTLDAPMVKFDPMRIIGKGRGDSYAMAEFGEEGIRPWWNKTASPASTFYSWLLTNHWEVNYKAYQEGEITFHYVLFPHDDTYNGVESEKKARGACQPLIAVEADPADPVYHPSFWVDSDEVIVTSIRPARDGKGQIVRLYNPQSASATATLKSKGSGSAEIHYCNSMGDPLRPAESTIDLPGYGVVTLRIETNFSSQP